MADVAKPCPICGKPTAKEHHPFCGRRCADVDLNRWLSGTYVVRTETDADEDEQAPKSSGDEAG